jgi:hypothetical protein
MRRRTVFIGISVLAAVWALALSFKFGSGYSHADQASSAKAPAANAAPRAVEQREVSQRAAPLEQRVAVDGQGAQEQATKAATDSLPATGSEKIDGAEAVRRYKQHFSEALESEPHDRSATMSYRIALEEVIVSAGLRREMIDSVDCRASMCRITLLTDSNQRESLNNVWGNGPLTQGSFDYLTDTSKGPMTVIYAGVTGHPLRTPDPRTLPPSKPEEARKL